MQHQSSINIIDTQELIAACKKTYDEQPTAANFDAWDIAATLHHEKTGQFDHAYFSALETRQQAEQNAAGISGAVDTSDTIELSTISKPQQKTTVSDDNKKGNGDIRIDTDTQDFANPTTSTSCWQLVCSLFSKCRTPKPPTKYRNPQINYQSIRSSNG